MNQKLPPVDYSNQRPRRAGSPGILVIIILGLVAYFILARGSNLLPPSGEKDTPNSPNWSEPVRSTVPGEADSTPAQSSRNARADRGDWSIEEVDGTSAEIQLESAPNGTNKSSSKGDWSIEEVDSPDTADADTRLSQPGDKKRTEKGDWSLEQDR
jgi:hypothetical protein